METFGNNLGAKKGKKKAQSYLCILCDYKCCKKYDWERHITTSKHIKEINGNEMEIKNGQNGQKFICEYCNKIYDTKSGLWKHKSKKICTKNNDITNNLSKDEVILMLIKENKEFKELLIEQNKQLIEISKDKTISNNCNNTNNITNNNNHFNLNLFLNETCKNAMNINEFVERIPVSINDLEDTGRLGYAEGISRIFIKGLKQLEVNERPIHCSDGKRETVYIKEGDVWEKDDSDKSKLTNAIRKIGHKNIRMIPEWKKKYPDCEDYYSKKNDLYLKIVNQSMCGGSIEETETNYNKIRKNIIKQVIIEK
jgi:hypothetical protein